MGVSGFRVGLAVSGGADSTALLVLMAELRRTHGFDAVVLHVDHGLRRDSADDAAFVKRLAARFGLPFHEIRTKVVPEKGESVEMAARRVRLAFFASCMKRLHLDCIATGHQMEDVAETFLLRLKRASGPDGLAGLKPVSFVGGITFIRPLLNVHGGDLRAFLRSRGIAWREDSTNADISIPRNKVRHVILPFLARELDPKIVEHIARSASYLREAMVIEKPLPINTSVRSVHSVVKHTNSKLQTPNSKPQTLNSKLKTLNSKLTISPSEGFEKTDIAIGTLPARCWMDANSLKGRTIEVRSWRPGDWMRPCGFPHKRKLQDIFVTAKTPPDVRHSVPLVADVETGEVLWLPGYRVSDTVKVPSPTSPSIMFTLAFGGGM